VPGSRCRGQAIVEVLALAPLVVAAVLAFAVAAGRLAAMARAEAALARAVAVDAAGASTAYGLPRRARLVRTTDATITVAVPAPLGAITLEGPRAR